MKKNNKKWQGQANMKNIYKYRPLSTVKRASVYDEYDTVRNLTVQYQF